LATANTSLVSPSIEAGQVLAGYQPTFLPRHRTSQAAFCIEPLKDRRWDEFVQAHPRASLFHSSAWLEALSRTYGYKAIAFTTSPAGQELRNGMVFCRVESWLTGRRLVSLPFSDHCEPLMEEAGDHAVLSATLERELKRGRWDYLEVRPLSSFKNLTPFSNTKITYAFHQLDLAPDLNVIYSNFHKSSTQRKIRRAEREGLTYREGSTQGLLENFYRLFVRTRQRHGLPPQAKKWFANLMDCFGRALKIRVAFKDDRAIAAIITIRHKDTLTYKYGCSDSRFNNLGCMHLLFWKAIQEAKASGLRYLDFGRTDAGQAGLITFKDRWGAAQSSLTYSRYGNSQKSTHLCDLYGSERKSKVVRSVLKLVSPAVLPLIGELLYKHIG